MKNAPDSLLTNPPNLNLFWGALIVEELVRNGVEHFFVSPGSRSTPVTWAIADNARATGVVHYDERGAAYAALGAARGSGRPAAVVCTSGTGAANLYPAVIEASQSNIPLIVLTADRPPELTDSGTNQAIDQLRLFGEHARLFFNMPCPNPEIAGRTVLTTVDQAVYRSRNAPAGPVHLNLMYREPLAPVDTGESLYEATSPLTEWAASNRPYTTYAPPGRSSSMEGVSRLAEIVRNAERGVLVAGQLGSADEAAAVLALARALNWPVLADITSGLRLGPDGPPFVHYYDQMLVSEPFREFFKPDAVIQVGAPYVSKRLQRHLQVFKPRRYVIVADHPYRRDPTHIATDRFESSVAAFCDGLVRALSGNEGPAARCEWLERLLRQNAACREAIAEMLAGGQVLLSEPAVAQALPSLLPAGATLFLSSSMPIRDADMYAAPVAGPVFATANRGTSGIDGVVATAAGYAHGCGRPVVLAIGDLALLHDVNSLALLKKVGAPVIVVVLNNFGGGIFSFLPIAAFPEHFETFWGTPHEFRFRQAAEMFELAYSNPATVADFRDAVTGAAASGQPALVEVLSDRRENYGLHREIQERVRRVLE